MMSFISKGLVLTRFIRYLRYRFPILSIVFFKRAATSIQRFYRFNKGRSKSQEDVLPPPTSPYIPPGNDAQTQGESEKVSGGLECHDSSVAGGSSMHVPIMKYISIGVDIDGSIKGDSSGSLGRNKTSTIMASRSSHTFGKSKLSNIDSRALRAEDLSGSTVDLNHDRRSFANLDGKKKVTRRMTIDLTKLESATIGTIESATCESWLPALTYTQFTYSLGYSIAL